MSHSQFSSETSSSDGFSWPAVTGPPPVAGADQEAHPPSHVADSPAGAAADRDAADRDAADRDAAARRAEATGEPPEVASRRPEGKSPPPADPASRSAAASVPVPPPPPPRSAPPPVRPPADDAARVPSGIGSARGPRWRGELEPVERGKAAGHGAESDDGGSAPQRDQVTRLAPPWLVSTIFHLLVLLMLALISTPAGNQITRVMLTLGESSEQESAELAEFAIEPDESLSESTEPVEQSPVDVDSLKIFDAADVPQPSEIMPVDLGIGEQSAVAPPMFSGRSGSMKKALMAMYGGTRETQDAVAKGLAWLKRNQQPGGHWSMKGPFSDGSFTENRIAATAMAVLAFLGDGHTHLEGEYSGEVEQGLKFLIQQQSRSGFFAREVRRDHEQMYAQSQAMIAVCEAYAMTRDSWLRPYAQASLDFAEQSQSSEGGWRYRPGPSGGSDTSVTGWFVMGLQSGRSAGLDVDISVLSRVSGYLDTVESFEGAAYAYQRNRQPSASMTAEGLLCRQYLGWSRDHPPLARGAEALLVDSPFDIDDPDVYYWYYATQVLHHFGGSRWRRWNEVMRVELPRAQVQTGDEEGSWSPQGDRYRSAGRLYTTCLSIYCLEVYYRHLPLYGRENSGNE